MGDVHLVIALSSRGPRPLGAIRDVTSIFPFSLRYHRAPLDRAESVKADDALYQSKNVQKLVAAVPLRLKLSRMM